MKIKHHPRYRTYDVDGYQLPESVVNIIFRVSAEWQRERDAQWHDKEVSELSIACDAAWAECVPDIGLHTINVNRLAAKAIRAQPIRDEDIAAAMEKADG